MSRARSAREQIETWRADGADHADPPRFQFIDALERRAAEHEGASRELLDGKLAELMRAYGKVLKGASADLPETAPGTPAPTAAQDTLVSLTEQLRARAGSYPEIPILAELRETAAKLRAASQVRQSEDHVPNNAGPLNSSNLVHRSLSLMHAMSPDYLRQFLGYVDTLSWLERVTAGHSRRTESARSAPARSRSKS